MNEFENEEMEQPVEESPQQIVKEFCANCGAEMASDQLYCPKCGHKKGEPIKPSKGNAGNKKNVMIGCGAALGIVIIIALFFIIRGPQAKEINLNEESITIKVGETYNLSYTIVPNNTKNKDVIWSTSNESISTVNNGAVEGLSEGTCTISVKTANGKTDMCSFIVEAAGPDFASVFDKYCKSPWASLASDGSYLSIDTNPNDSSISASEADALVAIISVNKELGLPDSVIEKMSKTRSLDGMQSAKGDGVEVSWTYHPDHGLEVTYSLMD